MSVHVTAMILLSVLLVGFVGNELVIASRRHLHRHHRWNDYDLEESVPRQLPLRSLVHEQNRRWRSQDSWRQSMEMRRYLEEDARDTYVRRRRHHDDIKALRRQLFEMEVEKAMNDTLCNYTVEPIEPIEDVGGNWILKDLKHVKCKHIGSKCQNGGPHCCIQTYMDITVAYSNKFLEQRRIYTGCVCGHRRIANMTPQLDYSEY